MQPPLQATAEEESIHQCPFGCGQVEDHLHYVKCPRPERILEREKIRGKLVTRLQRLRTNEFICTYIGYALKTISENGDIEPEFDVYNTEDELILLPAILGQKNIGWENLLKGFVHNGWAVAQRKHYLRMGLTSKIYNIKRWKRMFLTILTDYSNECWKMRNETLHGERTLEGRKIRKNKIVEQVKILYSHKCTLRRSPYRHIFAMNLNKRIKMGIQSLILWVGKAEEVLKLHREEADKNTIHRWLDSR